MTEIEMGDIIKYVSCTPECCVKNGIQECGNCPFDLNINHYVYISKRVNR